ARSVSRKRSLPKSSEHLFGLGVIGMLLQKSLEHGSGFVRRILEHIDASEIQIGLIERGSDTDALLKARDCLITAPGAKVKHAEIVQCLGVIGTQLQGSLQIVVSPIRVVELRVDHGE